MGAVCVRRQSGSGVLRACEEAVAGCRAVVCAIVWGGIGSVWMLCVGVCMSEEAGGVCGCCVCV